MTNKTLLFIGATAWALASAGVATSAETPRQVRWQGQVPHAPPMAAPQGALLNPNPLYWDETLYSGVMLAFDGKEVPADGRFGRAWMGGAKGGTLTATFPAPYALDAIALKLRGGAAVTLETADGTNEPPVWLAVADRAAADDIPLTAKDETWICWRLAPARTNARWRIVLAPGAAMNAISLWGSGPGEPVVPAGGEMRKKFPIAFESLPGADATTFSDHVYWAWQRPLLEDERLAAGGAVWAQHDKWARIANAPILPPHRALNQPVHVVMARNEHEGALLTLTSLKDRAGKPIHDSGIYKEFQPGAQAFRLSLGPVNGPTPDQVRLTLRVAGTLRTQLWGVVPGPLFAADNKPCPALMLTYLTNGRMIADYPMVALPPCGSLVFWLEVRTEGAEPGLYTTTLTAAPGPAIPVTVEVLPVTLPSPRVWVHSWSQGAVGTTWPFTDEEVLRASVADKISRGISSFSGVPTPGTEAAEALRQKPDVYFFYNYIIPNGGSGKPWVSQGYGNQSNSFYNLTEKDHEVIRAHVEAVAGKYKEAGVDYADWVGELWDEPGEATAPLAAIAAKWVKAVDPKVQVYINPSFPQLSGFRTMSAAADCFVPFWGNWFKEPVADWQAEIKPGRINAVYAVQGSNRAELHEELVGHYRIMPWHAFKLGLQGWGFYAYYSPRGEPYTDYDPPGSETDYQVVYPGPRGPVPSRQAEAYRDGWEDYRLLTLLSASGAPEAREALAWALAQMPMQREPLTGTGLDKPIDFEGIRLRLLQSAAKVTTRN